MAAHVINTKENIDMKSRIIREAKAMFMEKGYDNSPVNALLERMNIAKGTFYHYFKSKEELFNSVVKDFTNSIMAEMNLIVREKTDALTKLNRVMSVGRQRKTENMALMKMFMAAMYRPENIMLRHKILQVTVGASAEVLKEIIRQGEREGVFNPVGEEAGFIIMNIGVGLSDILVPYVMKPGKTPEDMERIRKMSETYNRSVERLLGVGEGKITLMDREFLDALK